MQHNPVPHFPHFTTADVELGAWYLIVDKTATKVDHTMCFSVWKAVGASVVREYDLGGEQEMEVEEVTLRCLAVYSTGSQTGNPQLHDSRTIRSGETVIGGRVGAQAPAMLGLVAAINLWRSPTHY